MRISSARKARKMVSLVMSEAILLTNLFAPMVAYAAEYDGQETELESEAVTENPEEETEIHTQLYTVTIPPNGDCTFKYDTSRKKKSGNENIVLEYAPGRKEHND